MRRKRAKRAKFKLAIRSTEIGCVDPLDYECQSRLFTTPLGLINISPCRQVCSRAVQSLRIDFIPRQVVPSEPHSSSHMQDIPCCLTMYQIPKHNLMEREPKFLFSSMPINFLSRNRLFQILSTSTQLLVAET
jgi:hypothetical protein